MPKAVKGYVLRNPSRPNPVLEVQGEQGLCHSLEHLPRGTLAAECEGFIGQRQNGFRPGFLGHDVHTPATVRTLDYVLPLQAYDVADTKPRKTGEKSCRLYNRFLARRVGKHFHFLQCQELTACAGFLGVFQSWGDVVLYAPILVCLPQYAFQLVQVVVGCGRHHFGVGLRGERQHVGEEALAVFHRQVVKCAAAAAILLKVLIGNAPVPEIVAILHLGAEVFKEALLAPVAVEEAELFVDDGFRPFAFDKLRIA